MHTRSGRARCALPSPQVNDAISRSVGKGSDRPWWEQMADRLGGWGDEEGAVLVEVLRYAAERCTFPHGSVAVVVGAGNHLTSASAGPGAAVWKELEGKFYFGLKR